MKPSREFIPLNVLVHSTENLHRLYFLYRQAAESGIRGARLRFEWFRKRQDPGMLGRIEASFR